MGNCCRPSRESKIGLTSTQDYITPSGNIAGTFAINPANFIQISTLPITKDYEIGETLASGSFGEVYIGTHLSTGIKRAIKVIYIAEPDKNDMEKLCEEVSVLKVLDHPNIIRIFEVFNNKNKLYIVTELCTGGELFERIQKSRRFGENQAAKYMLDIVSAIMHCHNQNIVHRDLKPENILFENSNPDAKLKLVNFGTSKFIKPEKRLSQNIGTCYYMAPEILTSTYSKEIDVWSLGVILYIMLSGHMPFPGSNDNEIYAKIKGAPLNFMHQSWLRVSEEAKILLRKMLDKNPNTRCTINQVFNDNWLQTRGLSKVIDKEIEADSLQRLSCFSTHSKLQTAIYVFIVSQLLDNSHFDKLREVFMCADKDGDGFLSKNEIEKATEDFNFKIDTQEIMKQCDTDKNGLINYSEFLTATVNKNKAYCRKNLENAFKRFDKNGDGQIDKEELRESLGKSAYESIVNRMVDEADTNKDGKINFDEFVEHMNKYSKEISEIV
ncbi:hypothetical protein SteCoe_12794 [Stentor coeruleus]|uniref:non-specific serine/threonine protein kinase n=1 Tax=Stentor coeruleus TaxID=5963 RepID=A0A1R2C9Z0_9CILI|nr:hypothetical protein SteCoe_12794 [Stentor coeruleus]